VDRQRFPDPLPFSTGGGSEDLRVERADDARQDRRGRRAMGADRSTNLNIASWLGNWELDVVIEDENIGEADGPDVPGGPGQLNGDRDHPEKPGPAGQTRVRQEPGPCRIRRREIHAERVMRVGSAIKDAVTGLRPLSQAESASHFSIALGSDSWPWSVFFCPG